MTRLQLFFAYLPTRASGAVEHQAAGGRRRGRQRLRSEAQRARAGAARLQADPGALHAHAPRELRRGAGGRGAARRGWNGAGGWGKRRLQKAIKLH